MCPSSHSSCSRTSTTTGSPDSMRSRAWEASISEISDLVCCKSSRYVGIAIGNIALLRELASPGMSARARVWIVVGLAAVAAAGTVVGVTLATRNDIQHPSSKPPPFASDPTARPEVARQVREALKAWPAGTARRLRILAARYPHSALVQ